jgi:3-dehydroquinate dehydratase-1
MIFVSISNTDIEKCSKLIEKYKTVELRLDLIKPDLDELPLLISKAETSICTYRTSEEPKKSLEYILSAIEYGTDAVDFSLSKPKEDIEEVALYCRNNNAKLMLSYHNFESTPDTEYLEGLINEADAYSPDMIKIACMAKSDEDNDNLLELMKVNERIIPVPMGEIGIKGRLKAYFYGSPVVYAYPDGEKPTAPGQLAFSEYKDMDKILSIINR